MKNAGIVAEFPRQVVTNNDMSGLIESPNIEKRLSPRIGAMLPIECITDNVKGIGLNLNETGICFESERQMLGGDILLSVDLSNGNSKEVIEIPSKVVWNKASVGNGFRFGAQFVSINEENTSKIRDFIFDSYAQKASAVIKESCTKELQEKIEDFFKTEVRHFHEVLTALSNDMANQKTELEDIVKIIPILTNNLLEKGNTIEKLIDNEKQVKEIKKHFQGIDSLLVL